MQLSRSLIGFSAGCAALVGSLYPVSAADVISAKDFGALPECTAIKGKYPGLVGKKLAIGLGGFAAGLSAPSASDPNVIEGLDPDLWSYMSSCVGFTYELTKMDFAVVVTSIMGRRIDTAAELYVTKERLEKIAFVSSWVVLDGALVAKGNPKNIKSTDDLCGVKVAAVAGTYEAVNLVPPANEKCLAEGKKPIELVLVPDNAAQVVMGGQADIYMTALTMADSLAAASSDVLEVAFPIPLPIRNGFPIAKENTELRGAFFDALSLIAAKGILGPLLDKWGQGAASERPVENNG